jgi:hypothetical protein
VVVLEKGSSSIISQELNSLSGEPRVVKPISRTHGFFVGIRGHKEKGDSQNYA